MALLLFVSLLLAIALTLYRLHLSINTRPTTPSLPGPPSASLLWGHDYTIQGASQFIHGPLFASWVKKYGDIFEIGSVGGGKRLVVCDLRAVGWVLNGGAYGFVRQGGFRRALASLTGPGVSVMEGEAHKLQRKQLRPFFSSRAIKDLYPSFLECALQMKDQLDQLLSSTPSSTHGSGTIEIDAEDWATRYSLDTIGLSVFAHRFSSISSPTPTPLTSSLDKFISFQQGQVSLLLPLLANAFPWLVRLPLGRLRLTQKIGREMDKLMKKMLDERRASWKSDKEGEGVTSIMRNLLILEDPETGAMSEEQVIAQMKTFFLAGYESTAAMLVWILHELSLAPAIQQTLRAELISLPPTPTHDELDKLPYLDAVVKEVLRLRPSTNIMRVAKESCTIPLSTPLPTGQTSLQINKGAEIFIPIAYINTAASLWGEDGEAFRPERWLDGELPKETEGIRGYWRTLTFIDGPRICIGRELAFLNLKVATYTVIRSFHFVARDGPNTQIERFQTLLPRPKLRGEVGCRLPMLVRSAEE